MTQDKTVNLSEKRIKNLDFLRAIAVIAVLFQHSSWMNRVTQSGWAGVDLFFVLSGFLICTLLFNEIKSKNTVNPKLFLIRRGFKIYPSFYFFLITTILLKYFFYHENPGIKKILSELFFLQSYLPSVWLHSWSLAIEEHFYIFIALLIWLWTKTGFIFRKRQVFFSLIGIWVLLSALRYGYCIIHINEEPIRFFQSHLRSDGLLSGCILGYCFAFSERFKNILNKFSPLLLISGLIFLSPLYFWKTGSFNMDSFGITSLEIAFMMITGVAAINRKINLPKIIFPVYRLFCFIGLHSYSIYLWHAFVMDECDRHIKNVFYHTLIYIPSSIIIGIVFSRLIEWPFLRLREKFFPGKL